jgi:hypothetical protein
MPDGYSKNELAKSPSPAQLDDWERELDALELWHKTADYEVVAKHFGLKNPTQARLLINRGAERFLKDENVAMKNRAKAQMTFDLAEFRRLLTEAVVNGDLSKIGDALKVQERMSKLHGLDDKTQDEHVMPEIVILNQIPGAAPAALPAPEDAGA